MRRASTVAGNSCTTCGPSTAYDHHRPGGGAVQVGGRNGQPRCAPRAVRPMLLPSEARSATQWPSGAPRRRWCPSPLGQSAFNGINRPSVELAGRISGERRLSVGSCGHTGFHLCLHTSTGRGLERFYGWRHANSLTSPARLRFLSVVGAARCAARARGGRGPASRCSRETQGRRAARTAAYNACRALAGVTHAAPTPKLSSIFGGVALRSIVE